jgi:hypothetical protein
VVLARVHEEPAAGRACLYAHHRLAGEEGERGIGEAEPQHGCAGIRDVDRAPESPSGPAQSSGLRHLRSRAGERPKVARAGPPAGHERTHHALEHGPQRDEPPELAAIAESGQAPCLGAREHPRGLPEPHRDLERGEIVPTRPGGPVVDRVEEIERGVPPHAREPIEDHAESYPRVWEVTTIFPLTGLRDSITIKSHFDGNTIMNPWPRPIALLGAPSSIGIRPYDDGAIRQLDRAPAVLRALGLAARLNADDLDDVTPPPYQDFIRPAGRARNEAGIVAYSRALAERVRTALAGGRFTLLLGGDCSIVLERLEQPGLGGFWIHLDADVLASDVMPAVDSPDPNGLDIPTLTELLRPLVHHPGALGLALTIYDPGLDPDRACAVGLAALLEDVLAGGSS